MRLSRNRNWGHPELVAAVTAADADGVRAVLDAYYAHGVKWADRLAAGGIEFRLNFEVGRDASLAELRERV